MGEKEPEKNEGEKKSSGDGAAAAASGPVTVVLKVDLHCEGCAQKVKKSLKHLNGVESVKTDFAGSKVTVVGKVKPDAVKQRVEEKIKKKVELVSPQTPKNDKEAAVAAPAPAGDGKKPEEKPEKKAEEPKKAEEKKPPPVITVVLKARVHCDGCAHKMKKIISKYEGVQDVSVDLVKDQITIKGTMDMKEMLPYLSAKLKRPVDIVPPPAKKDEGGDKKPKEAGGGDGGDKKGKDETKQAKPEGGDEKKGDSKPATEKSVEENVEKVEIVNKMEHYGYPHGYGAHTYNPFQASESGYVSEHWHAPNQYMHAPNQYMHAPNEYMYSQQQYMPGPSSYEHAPAPQMFSDENPNACSIM